MEFVIKRAEIKGTVKVPSSKSEIQRAIAAATLVKGQSIIRNVTFSDDVLVAIELSKNLGSEIQVFKNQIVINGDLHLKTEVLNANESGLSTRLFLPIASLTGKNFTITGKGTLLKRKMDSVAKNLYPFGVNVETNNGYLPFEVKGKLNAGNVTIDASETSQLLSGLLMALPLTKAKSTLQVSNLKSKPYIDLTLDIMQNFGVKVQRKDYKEFTIEAQQYLPTDISLKGDWSGGAFWFVAAAIAGDLTIKGLDPHSKQADKAILEVMKLAGVDFINNGQEFIVRKSHIKSFEFDATDCPDLFPPLAVLAANADGISKIKGVSRLKAKESDRAMAIKTEFQKQGIEVRIDGDYMFISGSQNIKGGRFETYKDHRMAMCGAVLALNAENNLILSNIECVSKSYPDFFDELERLLSD